MEPVKNAFLLKEQLDALRPFPQEQSIHKTFRLDWTYHSCRLEGNSLTYEEARSLLWYGLAAQSKPAQDQLEIQAHHEAVHRVVELAEEGFLLTERSIRELHAMLYQGAQTSSGEDSKTQEWGLGQYKTQPRHGNTVTGDTFHFAHPLDTPGQMEQLVNWYREKATSAHVNAVSLAAEFHYRFTRIHPFETGNGLMARLLMNFILLRFGFPPVIIRADDRQNYLSALQQADSGLIEMFVTYIAERLTDSLERVLRAAREEDIYDSDELDRELALLRHRLTNQEESTKSAENLFRLFSQSVIPLFRRFEEGCRKFEKFYSRYRVRYTCDDFEADSIPMAVRTIVQLVTSQTDSFGMEADFEGFGPSEAGGFGFRSGITIRLGPQTYAVQTAERGSLLGKGYGELLTDSEMDAVVAAELLRHKAFIEARTQSR